MTETRRCIKAPQGAAAAAAEAVRAALPELRTDRLHLREPVAGDIPAWTKVCSEGFGDTAEQAWQGFCIYVAGWLIHGHGLFAVCLRDTGQVIGFVSLGLEWDDHEPELGYMFDAEFHGQGYATEACAAVRDFGFERLGRGAFVSYVKTTNDRSNALSKRIGGQRDPKAETQFGGRHNVWRHGVSA